MRQVLSVTKMRTLPSWQQWKQLPRLLTPGEKKTLNAALGVFLFACLSLLGTYLFSHRVNVPAVGGAYTEGLVGEPRLLNPLYAQASDTDQDLTRLIYSGLLRYDPEEGYVPDLAESLSVSEDGLTYTLKIKEHARFHNGEDVRARDVLFTVNAIQNPAYHSPLIDSFYRVSVVQEDERTVSFILEEPFAPFVQSLTVGILPASLWAEILPQNAPLAALNLQPVGSGPYRFEAFAKDQRGSIRSYTLTRNEDFYDAPAFIETITFKFYQDTMALGEALENKNVEGAGVVRLEDLERVAGNSEVQLLLPTIPQETILYLNQTVQPILGDLAVRSAIASAIDKQKIVEAVPLARSQIIHAPILEGQVGYDAGVQVAYNESQAHTLLEEAGYRLNADTGLRGVKGDGKQEDEDEQAAPATLGFTLTALDSEEMRAVAARLQEDFANIGITLSLSFVPSDLMYSQVIEPRNFELLLASILMEGDPNPYPFWHSTQAKTGGLNFANYSNADVDTLLLDGRKEMDASVRAQKYQQFQQLLAKDVPVVFLYQSRFAHALAQKIRLDPPARLVIPADRFANVTSWYIKTKQVLR
ncbi:peptide ABC transporter substrate-binding protein [Candidatus Uhrbacteria bacterium]|nr:peptide ABC transporter substrate-binding protein [Candidatus Uhrbacteria bacterium]